MTGFAAAALVAAALVIGWRWRNPARRRLRRICGATPSRPPRRLHLPGWLPILAGLGVVMVLEGWFGVAAGIGSAVALRHALRRAGSRNARNELSAAAADLPFAIDLIAASVRAGAPPAVATQAVGDALDGPLGARLRRVAYALGLGAAPQDAWAHLRDVPGAARLAAAAVRSSQSGAALADALTRLADELRGNRVTACEAAARRAGVLVVLPLGLCFLPAFVLAGLVPIVMSVLGDVIQH